MSEGGLRLRVIQDRPMALHATLHCQPGQVLALVGPSGAGKSSLLRIIAGLLHPAEGMVHCGGQMWLDTARGLALPARHRRVGFVFQHHALFPHLTALENVMEALTGPDRRTRARAWLRRVHLGGMEERRPCQMSGGQQQRVGVARALAREPKVLLLDEPFSSVDRVTREKLHLEVAEILASLAIPVVLVTHDLDEAAMLAHRMVVLSRGQTLQEGTPEEVTRVPENLEVARLVGHRNILSGFALGVESAPCVDWEGVSVQVHPATSWSPGTKLSWVISPGDLRLRPLDDPMDRPGHTYLRGCVISVIRQGDLVRGVMNVNGHSDLRLHFACARHLADRSQAVPGAPILVALPADRIRLFNEMGAAQK